MSRVSVVLPCLRGLPGVRRAIDSCMRQQLLREVIVVASQFETMQWNDLLAICSEYGITCLRTEFLNGAAKNLGVEHATGEFLCLLYPGDQLLSGYFPETVTLLDSEPLYSSAKVGMQFVDEKMEPLIAPDDPRYKILLQASACNMMVRRSSFLKLGGFPVDHRLSQGGGVDAAFSGAVERFLNPICFLPEAFYRHCDAYDGYVSKYLQETRLFVEGGAGSLFASDSAEMVIERGAAVDEYFNSIHEKFAIS